ncbi:HpcH/HpaI aldolase family protein [Paenibacillus eucommiae]|uniref:4-hydroxy-2-oxoheptanedioate aldolase n=1 Tax=Paenibacillus eucommiae TaxID=1355755 RepID=A0ABS4J6B5_9BACL|nr:aldolase/citrate lyase family protein [Paenibacillus eucommiae]MBP1995392.1 4-hydroxy-2-oxoheptanedioate aldolase [Paenibacillus eucommiae]
MNKGRRVELSFKQSLNNGQCLHGTFVKTPSPEIIEILGLAGFDFIIIDMEHTTLSFQDVERMVRVADLHGLHAIVRIHGNLGSHILHALDLGATGVQVPQIDTAEEVASLVNHTKYPPLGIRGATSAHRAANYGFSDIKEYLDTANAYSTVVAHIETRRAFENIEEICQIDGLDVVFIGPLDLSISLGTDMNMVNGQLSEYVMQIIHTCKEYGKYIGTVVNSEAEYKFAMQHNIPYIVWGSDLSLFKSAVVKAMDVMKQIQSG